MKLIMLTIRNSVAELATDQKAKSQAEAKGEAAES
jgi:hypothetical protein